MSNSNVKSGNRTYYLTSDQARRLAKEAGREQSSPKLINDLWQEFGHLLGFDYTTVAFLDWQYERAESGLQRIGGATFTADKVDIVQIERDASQALEWLEANCASDLETDHPHHRAALISAWHAGHAAGFELGHRSRTAELEAMNVAQGETIGRMRTTIEHQRQEIGKLHSQVDRRKADCETWERAYQTLEKAWLAGCVENETASAAISATQGDDDRISSDWVSKDCSRSKGRFTAFHGHAKIADLNDEGAEMALQWSQDGFSDGSERACAHGYAPQIEAGDTAYRAHAAKLAETDVEREPNYQFVIDVVVSELRNDPFGHLATAIVMAIAKQKP